MANDQTIDVGTVTQAPSLLAQMALTLDALAQGEWWRVPEGDLVEVLGALGRVRHQLSRAEVRATAEVIDRGIPRDRCLTPVDYLTQAQARQAPMPPVGHALMTVRLAEAVRTLNGGPGLGTGPGGAQEEGGAVAQLDPAQGGAADDGLAEQDGGQAKQDAPLRGTLAAFDRAELGPSRAAAIVQFHDEVAPHSPPDALAAAMTTINQGATDTFGPRGLARDALGIDRDPESVIRKHGWTDRQLRVVLGTSRKIIKPAREKEESERRGRTFRSLHSLPVGEDLTEYRLVVEPEGAAVVDAAISALSAPEKDDDGAADPRTPAQRRADALLTIVRRGVSAPEGVSQTTKAQVMVTIPLTALTEGVDGAGITMTGQVLSPTTVRRLACDGSIIPAVLGTEGQILEMGHDKRLFTPGQHRALWHRDKHCSYPGCTIPPQWCDAHHVRHWADGGPTDMDNGALLCGRHHTYVHANDVTATVTSAGVTWHT
ncbi:DUF222 domain-containing protein [Pseudactinotalea sp. Z1739]|uniref:HNH endonuclease signature motif containing protein n=1 Tax=Pseudactinotalea sp. Z1739 TaxID=3413028 RepID=UPI003C7A0829